MKLPLILFLSLFLALENRATADLTMTVLSGFDEGAADVSITLARSGDASFAFSVDYFFSDDTAKAGKDYRPQTGRLDFAAKETTKSFVLPNPVMDNGTVDSTRTVQLNLTNATHDVRIQTPRGHFEILDNEKLNILDRTFQFDNPPGFRSSFLGEPGSFDLKS